MMNKNILVTGCAGFIGFHLSRKLIELGFHVTGVDNINNYYDIELKHARIELLNKYSYPNDTNLKSDKEALFNFFLGDIADKNFLFDLVKNKKPKLIINLAAQAGVRYSINKPHAYIESNIHGFLNVLECCREYDLPLVYASSSSVYGNAESLPLKENGMQANVKSIYAMSKKANEEMANIYSEMFGIQTIGLRFFTVYGPFGRPDMAPFLFLKAILNKEPIKVYNYGKLKRDFTYIDDIIQGILIVVKNLNEIKRSEIFNIGRGESIELMDFLNKYEEILGLEFERQNLPMQDGDVYETWADTTKLMKLGYLPTIGVSEGLGKFVSWYKSFYNV